MLAYKLFKVRKDGSIGPLFINRKQRIKVGEWVGAEDHPTKGYAHRPGWHCTAKPEAPHINTNREDRVWYLVEIDFFTEFKRPKHQGGLWYLARQMKVIKEVR